MADAYAIIRPNNSNRKIRINWDDRSGTSIAGSRAPPKILALLEYMNSDEVYLYVPPPPFDINNPVDIAPMVRKGSISTALEFLEVINDSQASYRYNLIERHAI